MNNLNESWLESLLKHSIFELNDTEKQQVKNATLEKTRNDNTTVDFLLQHHSQIMTLRGNDLFVAVGSTIRVLNLTTFKENWLKATQEKRLLVTHYKVLDTPEINFPIESLATNNNGKLLAVKGHNRLAVVCLPRQGFSDISEIMSRKRVACATLSIGTEIFKDSEIVKFQWHPLSENDTHLVILDDKSNLRIFDISASLDTPEQSFDLSSVSNTDQAGSMGGFTFNSNSKAEDVVSFSLGGMSKGNSGWEPFTIFYTVRSGDIYALSPVIPYKSCVRRNHLQNLKQITKAKFDLLSTNDGYDEGISYLYKLQLLWINTLLKSARIIHKTTPNNSEGDVLSVSSNEQHNIYPVQKQGPFVTSANNTRNEPTDILHVSTDPVHVIVLAFTNGTVHNYILGSDIEAQWKMPSKDFKNSSEEKLGQVLSSSEYLPKASLSESINLKSHDKPAFQSMALVADPLYEDTYYIYHAAGVHAVSMNKWAEILRKANADMKSGKDREARKALDALFKKPIASHVRLLVDSSPFKNGYVPITGLAVISDLYLSYSLLSVTIDYQLITTDLLIRRDSAASKNSQEAVKVQLGHLADDFDDQSLLSLPAYKIPPQLESLPKQSKVVIPSDITDTRSVVINQETLQFLLKFSERVRSESDDIKDAITKISLRLNNQQNEFERQVRSLRNLNDKLVRAFSDERENKIKELLDNHAKLRLRIDQQLRVLMASDHSKLVAEEETWITRLQSLSEKVNGSEGYASKIDLLKSRLESLDISKKKASKTKSSFANPTLRNILRTLNEQTNTIKDMSDRVKDLETKISSPAT